MKRAMIFDENEKVWRTANGRGFGIIDDGMYPEEKRHLLKICNEAAYREFDLINFCRDFKKRIGNAPNSIKATLTGLQSISPQKTIDSNCLYEIAEFKMKIFLLTPDCRNDYLEISYKD